MTNHNPRDYGIPAADTQARILFFYSGGSARDTAILAFKFGTIARSTSADGFTNWKVTFPDGSHLYINHSNAEEDEADQWMVALN